MDTTTLIATIVGSILASSGLWAVIQTIINKKTGRDKDISFRGAKASSSAIRTRSDD